MDLKKSIWTACGDISANAVQATLTTFVIGTLLIDNPSIFVYLKWAGISYIIYLAYETFTLKVKGLGKKVKPQKVILQCIEMDF